MELKEVLIGYDIREMWLDITSLWNMERRKTFLLRRDVPKPASVDPAVWPSVFDVDIAEPAEHMMGIGRQDTYNTSQWDEVVENHTSLTLPGKTGYRQSLWNDLSELKQAVSIAWSTIWKPVCVIAVTKVVNTSDDEQTEAYSNYFVHPNRLHPSWQLLGYDVADDVLTGFISNAGYREDEIEILQTQWVRHFNQWHLFDSRDLAMKYVDVARERDPMHGPFAAYGIYGIQRLELGEQPDF